MMKQGFHQPAATIHFYLIIHQQDHLVIEPSSSIYDYAAVKALNAFCNHVGYQWLKINNASI